MNILVPGDNKRLLRHKKFECTRCGCVFVASNNEYSNQSNQHDGIMYGCLCPYCLTVTWNYSEKCCTEDGKYE